MQLSKKKLLIFVDWFEPGFKGGGQIRSAVNLVNLLKNQAEIFVVTSDRDFGDDGPYHGINADSWTNHKGYKIWYASPGARNYRLITKLMRDVSPHCIYVNGMFSWPSSVLPLVIKKFAGFQGKLVVAPRGMLKPSAKKHNRGKKDAFLFLLKTAGMYNKVHFHATDAEEAQNIRESLGNKVPVSIINDTPAHVPDFIPVIKKPGAASFIFIGRIHPVKNLLFLLETLEVQPANIDLLIITAEYNLPYWNLCKEKITSLPSNIKLVVREHVPHYEVLKALVASHALLLPTEGENFGHAIFESFAAGRPVVISDQTPWKELQQKKIGWDIPLSDKHAYSAAIAEIAAMDGPAFDSLCGEAWNFAKQWVRSSDYKEQYLQCFFA